MMFILRFFVALLLVSLACSTGASAADCPPDPAPDDLVLPGPGGACFAFRAVTIGEGDTPYVQKRFTMGDQEEGYKGYPTAVTVGGAFAKENDTGMNSWFFYLGKYEVTEGQYYKVMGLPKGADPKLLESAFPITDISYFDALNFINTLNLWLFANAPDALPSRGTSPGFLRLPTEAEWEFSARGGLNARPELFADYHPYGDNLAAYEWFFGPTSSHGKVQPVGKLKVNPLGLHDMLGNVGEMVQTAYQLEYYQGNTGGVTSRGGNYTTSEDKLRSSLRVEQPLYRIGKDKKAVPNGSKTTGFRLALGATVLSNREIINALQEGWDGYRETAAEAKLPAQLSTAPVEQRASVSIDETKASLQTIRETLKQANVPPSVLQTLGTIEAGMDKVTEMRKLADEDAARRFLDLAVLSGFDAGRELLKLGIVDEMLQKMADNPSVQERMKKRRQGIEDNIKNRLTAYFICLEALANVNGTLVDREMEKLRTRIKDMDFAELGFAADLLQKHSARFREEKRANTAAWREDFASIPKEAFMEKDSGGE
jgi:formylglycine-generating enzyme required for sulfatase activity